MNNEITIDTSNSGKIEQREQISVFQIEISDVSVNKFPTSVKYKLGELVFISSNIVDENYVNRERIRILKNRFTDKLIRLIEEEDFEYGYENKTDLLVREQMKINSLATKDWLNSIFVESFEYAPIVAGVLRIIARIDYNDIYPEGQTMAVAALSHKNIEVQECGIRAFESWGTYESLTILQNLKNKTEWLQEYINEVVSYLEKEFCVINS